MRLRQGGEDDIARKRANEGLHRTADELDRKFWMALGLYAFLAILAWFTMSDGRFFVMGLAVEFRVVPLIVIGGLVLRTVLARQAERIRRDGEEGGSGTPRS